MVFFFNNFMKYNAFFLSLNSWRLSWHLVSQSLPLLDTHSILFSCFQFPFKLIYSFLSLNEIQIISFSLSTSSFLSCFIFTLVAARIREWLFGLGYRWNSQETHIVVIVSIHLFRRLFVKLFNTSLVQSFVNLLKLRLLRGLFFSHFLNE